MPLANYLKVKIGDQFIVVNSAEELPLSITYQLEDSINFQNKKSGESFDIKIPANLDNDVASNTFRDPSIEDMTVGKVFKSWQKAYIESNGEQLLTGKAFLRRATHNSKPLSYTYNILGDNADWLVLLSDKTVYDFVKNILFTFDVGSISASWEFDGTDELLPYVFAPIRYRYPFAGYRTENGINVPDDDNVLPDYLKPSLSKYFILYWAFKSIGYRIQSEFMDLEYFRRQTMPWVFGNFLDSGGTKLDAHKFLAKSIEDIYFDVDRGKSIDEYVDLAVENDSTNGAFDNNDDYSYDAINFEMIWEYKLEDFGPLNAAFSTVVYYSGSLSGNQSNVTVWVHWFINGTQYQTDEIMHEESGIIGTRRPIGQTEVFFKTGDYGILVNVGDVVSAKVFMHLYRDKNAINDVAHISLNVLQFQLDYFRIDIGGTIDFSNYTSLQKLKIPDYIAGIVDEFDLSINTDVINKVVYIEPTHDYSIVSDPAPINTGYFKNDFIDWNGKEDSNEDKEWNLENFSDIERELTFKYKDDPNDGILKLIQDRNTTVLAQSKYVFPQRFLTGAKERINRFFSPTMHYSVTQWTDLGTGDNVGITPQLICIIPENVSNTSQSESDNIFAPKSCYYKGNITGAGAWRFNGEVLQTLPFMFAVNYQAGGENDPILSYSDENINGVYGIGLLKRFFWQRLAILRNGQRYDPAHFKLNNSDAANSLHREFKSYKGQKWELIKIDAYRPLIEDSTECLLYKWSPIIEEDFLNTFPTVNSLSGGTILAELDIKYAALKCLYSDIPT